MKVLIAASEAEPFAKTGGLADVAGSLYRELARLGVEAALVMPLYKAVREGFGPKLVDTGVDLRIPLGDKVYASKVFAQGAGKERAFFVECDAFFDREELYGSSKGGYPDNAERFIFFSRAVIETAVALGLKPDVIHSNDWQSGLVPVYMKTLYKDGFGSTASLFTIHNLGYQGIFPKKAFALSGLPAEMFVPKGVEFYGQMNFLKAGIVYADAVSTVSPNYAREILVPEHGFGLDGVLRDREAGLSGILNGIDASYWNPSKDGAIPKNYSLSDPSGKAGCRRALARECGLDGRSPILSMVGRLSAQKGIDLLVEAAPRLLSEGANMVVLGKGEEKLEKSFRALAKKHKNRLCLRIGFDEGFAHRVYAGSDIILIPSKYEPCGLIQMIAMSYGTVPVARRTGGLADTIEDYGHMSGSGTGFLFSDYSADALLGASGRALCVYGDPEKWAKIMSAGMKKDFSWKASAKKYISLYRSLIRKAGG